ncbi:NAD-binding protein [Russula ochroleuca]|uniref:NAD-binding protein n=1 Tax=Russula ochroleuca TaxID=152965 RepID=A0A9P5TCX2_9AGAM|nr:NAD-binding protein [Russula ochroleuca]
MSGYTNFAVVGAGAIGKYIVQQLLKDKAAGIIKEVIVLTRQGSNTTVQGDAKVIQVDYSNHASIKQALAGVHVIISTVAGTALDVQGKIAAAGKEAGVELFVPSEFGGVTVGETEGWFGAKGNIHGQLKALGMPYALFYTGAFADYFWTSYVDIASGKVTIGGDGNKQVKFTSRYDIARYVSYVLTHLPAGQLKNRAFSITGDNKSFNEIFKAYEEKTGKKLEVTYIPVSELDAKIAANPEDFSIFVKKYWATAGPFQRTDNHLYPDWNPTPTIDYIPAA